MTNSSRAAVGLSVLVLAGVGAGLERAAHSSLFLLRSIEFNLPSGSRESQPLDLPSLQKRADVPIGHTSLIDLALDPIEKRLLAEPWIGSVRLEKHFPGTLAIEIHFRDPVAIVESDTHRLSYIDSSGKIFGSLNLALDKDLPLLTGFAEKDRAELTDALLVVDAWSKAHWKVPAQISELSFDRDHGYRAVVNYALSPSRQGRTLVNLGQDVHTELDGQLFRISEVLGYLAQKQIAARQIFADSGKKIVVKIARRS